MSRMAWWMTAVILLAAPSVWAQGGGGGGGGGPQRPSNDTSIQDFKRAMELQAAPDQIDDLHALQKSSEEARQQAHALQEKANASDGTGLYQPASVLKDNVDSLLNAERLFVKRMTKPQLVLLKEHLKKLNKVEGEIAKESKNLDEQMKRSAIDPKELANVAGRMEKGLADLQGPLANLADEMGVPKL